LLFVLPEGESDDWAKTDLWRRAEQIEGVTPILDRTGVEAARFRVVTSGDALLYSPDRALLFHGGITPSRGHEGDNVGRWRIVQWMNGVTADRREAPVFGCPLGSLATRSEP
jgi:hypothetical protein